MICLILSGMMVRTKENLKQNYNDFHKKIYIYSSLYQRDVGKKERKKTRRKSIRERQARKILFFSPFAKRRETLRSRQIM